MIQARGWAVLSLGLVLTGFHGASGQSKGGDAGDRTGAVRKVEALLERDALRPGESVRLAVRVNLRGEYHVNSNHPSAEYLIPTRLETGPETAVEWGRWEYPDGALVRFPFAKEPLSVYEGTFLIRGAVRAAAGPPAEVTLHLILRYQACTREKCLPPAREEVSVPVRIVPEGTPTRPLHPEVFPPSAGTAAGGPQQARPSAKFGAGAID